MKINIEETNNYVKLYAETSNILLETLHIDEFLTLLDRYQLDAYYNGDTRFSINHVWNVNL